jgi:hypothetical protein
MKIYERALQDHVMALLERLNQNSDASSNNSSSGAGSGLQASSPAPGQTAASATGRAGGAAAGAAAAAGANVDGKDKDAAGGSVADSVAEHGIVQPQITVPAAQWPQELISLLNDKDHVSALIVASHDAHYACSVRVEEELRAAEEKRTESHLKSMNVAEHKRNRVRVEDIYCICEDFITEINQRGRVIAQSQAK